MSPHPLTHIGRIDFEFTIKDSGFEREPRNFWITALENNDSAYPVNLEHISPMLVTTDERIADYSMT